MRNGCPRHGTARNSTDMCVILHHPALICQHRTAQRDKMIADTIGKRVSA